MYSIASIFFVLCCSIFDLIFLLFYAIIVPETIEVCSASYRDVLRLTTYLTIDTLGAHGNNGYKTAEENLLWSRNRYKKPFAVERAKLILFGSITSQEHIPQSNFANTV